MVGQRHTGELGFGVSGLLPLNKGMLPSVRGNMQDQHTSVIGFTNRPEQLAPGTSAAAAATAGAATADRFKAEAVALIEAEASAASPRFRPTIAAMLTALFQKTPARITASTPKS